MPVFVRLEIVLLVAGLTGSESADVFTASTDREACRKAAMTLAPWPNEGFCGAKSKMNDQTVIVDTDRVARWTGERDPWVFAYWHHDWAELCEPVAGVEAGENVLLRKPEIKTVYGITPSRVRWYGLNLLSELDAPGEYYIDRCQGWLYFWPPLAKMGLYKAARRTSWPVPRTARNVTLPQHQKPAP